MDLEAVQEADEEPSMTLLALIPTARERESLIAACDAAGAMSSATVVGPLTLTSFPALNLVVAPGGVGKAQFAVHTQYLLTRHPWALVVCAGAAGALVDTLRIGDVVVGSETVEHDIVSRFGPPLLPRFPGAPAVLTHCAEELRHRCDPWLQIGPIASGDEDVVDTERRASIRARTGALAAAWEGAGGARACAFSGVPFLEVRGITDSADAQAAASFRLNTPPVMARVAEVLRLLGACVPSVSESP